MEITQKDWNKYISTISKLDKKAADMIKEWVNTHGLMDRDALIDYTFNVVQTLSLGTGSLAVDWYNAVADLEGVFVPAAEMAELPTYGEVAKTVNGVMKRSLNPDTIASAASLLCKRTAADTTLKNAKRDGAEFAWIPVGDTCAFCMQLASYGWRHASDKTIKGDHAEHIHANCDCEFAIRFGNELKYRSYDPDKYKEMFENAEGDSVDEKRNSIRRMQYQENKDLINAQKRKAYAERTTFAIRKKDKTVWEGVPKKVTKEEISELSQFAESKGIVLDKTFTSFDGDVDLVKDFIDEVNNNIADRSFMRNIPVKISVNYELDDDVYAITHGSNITINGFAYRDRTKLKEDYEKKLIEDKWFTKGSDYKNIATHECGHVIVYMNQLKTKGIVESVFGRDKEKAEKLILNNISDYATSNRDELIAESYVMYRNGSNNKYALKILEYCGIL